MVHRWPEVGQECQKLTEHALKTKHDAIALLEHNKDDQKTNIPWKVIKPFITSCLSLADKALVQPTMHETLSEIRAVKAETSAIKNAVSIIKTTVTAPEPYEGSSSGSTGYKKTRTWTQIATTKAMPPSLPPSYPSSFVSASDADITTAKEREVIVKLHDPTRISFYRAYEPKKIRDMINANIQQWHQNEALEQDRRVGVTPHQRAENGHNINGPRTTAVAAANQLKSGDLRLIAISALEAEKLRSEGGWAALLSAKAAIVRETYGVVMHGVPQNSMKTERQEEVIGNLQVANALQIPGIELTYVGFLRKDGAKKKTTSVVVEFKKTALANLAIRKGLLWEGQSLQCVRYDRASRICQCFKCWKYGHISESCTAEHEYCGKCAKTSHRSRDCPNPEEKRCKVCKGIHEAWSEKCPERRRELARVQEAKLTSAEYWPEAVTTRARQSSASSQGASHESASPSPSNGAATPLHNDTSFPQLTSTNAAEQNADNGKVSGTAKTSAGAGNCPVETNTANSTTATPLTNETQPTSISTITEVAGTSSAEQGDKNDTQGDAFQDVTYRKGNGKKKGLTNDKESNKENDVPVRIPKPRGLDDITPPNPNAAVLKERKRKADFSPQKQKQKQRKNTGAPIRTALAPLPLDYNKPAGRQGATNGKKSTSRSLQETARQGQREAHPANNDTETEDITLDVPTNDDIDMRIGEECGISGTNDSSGSNGTYGSSLSSQSRQSTRIRTPSARATA